MIHYHQCPVCGTENINKVFTAKDYTVSQQLFDILECTSCSLRFTNNIPGEKEMGAYYQSENYISHSNTRKGFINRLYHVIRNITLQSKKNILLHYTKKPVGNLLDIGSGTGLFLKKMKDAGWNVTGLEPDADARKISADQQSGSVYLPEKLFELPLHSFDAISLWHVLEHVHNLHTYMEQIKKLITPGGYLFVAVPNYTSADAAYYKEHWAAYDVPRHLYHFSPKSMQHLFEKHGFVLKKTLPMWFDSFYVSMLSEKYRNEKNNYFNAILRGSFSNLRALGDNKNCSSVIYVAALA